MITFYDEMTGTMDKERAGVLSCLQQDFATVFYDTHRAKTGERWFG